MAGNDSPGPKFLQNLLGQLPWVISMLALGVWFASKYDSRMAALEARQADLQAWRVSVEAQQRAEVNERMNEMQRTIAAQTEELKRLRGAVNAR